MESLYAKDIVMQKYSKDVINFFTKLCFSLFLLTIVLIAQASKPLWIFTPQTPVSQTLSNNANTQVVYTVTNHSSKPKNLIMRPIAGITSNGICRLPAKGSCTLVLNIQGATLKGDIFGGPILCQDSNPNQCYQPSANNVLQIRLTSSPSEQFAIRPSAGPNGSISPNQIQLVAPGSNLTFTATPNMGFSVKQWFVDGVLVQHGGRTFVLTNINANHLVSVTFGNLFAYISNDFGSGANNITRCAVDTTGDFSGCTIVASGFNNPFGLTFNREGTRIYIANFAGAQVTKCDIDTNHDLINCSNSGTGLNQPLAVTFNPQGNLIYISNVMGQNVTRCNIATNGDLTNCVVTQTFTSPNGITFNPDGTRFYVENADFVFKCDVDSNGDLANCSQSATGASMAIGITLNATATKLYIVDGPNMATGSVIKCDVATNGGLVNCSPTGTTGFTSRFLVFHPDQTFAYVTNATSDNVSKCEMDSSGNLINCTTTGSKMNGATGIQLIVL